MPEAGGSCCGGVIVIPQHRPASPDTVWERQQIHGSVARFHLSCRKANVLQLFHIDADQI